MALFRIAAAAARASALSAIALSTRTSSQQLLPNIIISNKFIRTLSNSSSAAVVAYRSPPPLSLLDLRWLCEQEGQVKEAIELMIHNDGFVKADPFCFSKMFLWCGDNMFLEYGKKLHQLFLQQFKSEEADSILIDELMYMYCRCGSMNDLLSHDYYGTLIRPPSPSVYDLRELCLVDLRLGELCWNDKLKEAIELMDKGLVKADALCFGRLFALCCKSDSLEYARKVEESIMQSSTFKNFTRFIEDVIDMYLGCNSMRDARRVFDNMPVKTINSYKMMIDGYLGEDNSFLDPLPYEVHEDHYYQTINEDLRDVGFIIDDDDGMCSDDELRWFRNDVIDIHVSEFAQINSDDDDGGGDDD